ncbi:PQ loop repeat-domain-containing protein [Trichophaea hybrida]|nr:PQ loop repeat-domain-containing protein [Trichophaea hybrida]
MSSPLSPLSYILPDYCEPDTPVLAYLSQKFGTCIPSYLALASTTAGLLSITSWLFAQMPQIWKNYRRGSVDGLSFGFLSVWLAGDVCNLLGALWTGQMWFQQIVALYYVAVDIVLVCQYFYFTSINRSSTVIIGHPVHYDDSIDDDDDGSDDSYLVDSDQEAKNRRKVAPVTRVRSRSLASTLIVVISLMFHLAGASPIINSSTEPSPSTGYTLRDLGGVLSWFSTFLYLTSRLPQLLMNFRRRSTSGLAISLFAAAFCGNFFYSMSLLLNPLGHYDYPPYGGGGIAGPDGNDHFEWWGRTLPFFLGASGVLGEDAAVGWQWLMWGEKTPKNEIEVEYEEEGECCGVETQWNKWWPWNGWFEDSDSEEGKPLVGGRMTLVYGTEMASGSP